MLKGTLVCNNSLSLHSFQLNSTPLLYLLMNVMLLEAHDVQVQHGSCSSPRLIRPSVSGDIFAYNQSTSQCFQD
jgi:hypothetical protein